MTKGFSLINLLNFADNNWNNHAVEYQKEIFGTEILSHDTPYATQREEQWREFVRGNAGGTNSFNPGPG